MASTGLTTALTRPVRGSIATTAPEARPSARWQAWPTARSQEEALAGRITEGAGLARPTAVRAPRRRERVAAVTGETWRPTSPSASALARYLPSRSPQASTRRRVARRPVRLRASRLVVAAARERLESRDRPMQGDSSMRNPRSGVLVLLALSLLRPAAAAAQKLDNDDKK